MAEVNKDRRFARGIAAGAVGALALGGVAASAGLITVTPWTSAARAAAVGDGAPCTASFADLIARVAPAVVSVVVQAQPPAGGAGAPAAVPVAEGTAFFISADGYLVTADHVVHGAQSVQIDTSDGASYRATIVGSDSSTDIAVLKVNSAKAFPYVEFAGEQSRVGDWVVAIGNPFGLAATASAGIVSAVGRDLGDPYLNYLQVDAPIDQGNSGGPVFDLGGNVVGINDAIVSQSAGGSSGIAFAIPADTAKAISAALVKSGSIARAWLGVHVQDGALANVAGALVSDTESNGPAAQIGIVAGDVVTAVNNAKISDARGLTQSLIGLNPGSSVQLQVLHAGQTETIAVTLGVMPAPP